MPTWFEKFKRAAMTVEAGPFTAVDFDRDQIRIVYADHRGLRTRIVRLESVAIPPTLDVADPVALGELLGSVVRRSPHRGGGLVLGVPRSRAVLQTLRLPAGAPESELATMVRFQVEKELAFPPDEAVIDFVVAAHYDSPAPTGAPEGEALDVLVAAVKLPVVDYYRKIAEAAKHKLLRLTLRPYASACCLATVAAAGQPSDYLALVHTTADEFEVSVVTGQTLAFSRSGSVKLPRPAEPDLPAPAMDPGAAEAAAAGPPRTIQDAAEEVIADASRTLKSYLAVQRQSPVKRVLVAGGTGMEEQVVKGLGERLGVPAELFDPQAALGIRDKNNEVPAYIAALGLALGHGRPERLPFDFLNPKRPRVRRNIQKIRRISLAGGAVAVVALAVLLGSIDLWRKSARVDSLKRSLASLKEKGERVRALQKRVKVLDGWLNGTPNWLDQWALLSGRFPDAREVYITGLHTAPDGTINFTVRARSDADITDLGHRLEDAGYAFRAGQVSAQEDPLGYTHTAADVRLTVTPKVKIELAALAIPPRPSDDGSADPPAPKPQRREVLDSADHAKNADRQNQPDTTGGGGAGGGGGGGGTDHPRHRAKHDQ